MTLAVNFSMCYYYDLFMQTSCRLEGEFSPRLLTRGEASVKNTAETESKSGPGRRAETAMWTPLAPGKNPEQ